MKKLTKKTARKYVKNLQGTVTLHQAVCLALGFEPEGERPTNPSLDYLRAERSIFDQVPMTGKPEHLTNRQWTMQLFLEMLGQSGAELEESVRSFGELPVASQDVALMQVRARIPTTH